MYSSGVLALITGGASWADDSQDFRLALCGKGYRPKASHESAADLTHELRAGNYRRRAITGRAVVADGSRVKLLADSVVWKNLYLHTSYRWLVIVHQNTIDGSTTLLCAIDAGEVDLEQVTDHTVKFSGKDKAGVVVALGTGKEER